MEVSGTQNSFLFTSPFIVSGGDKADMYKLSMGRGQNIEVVMTADNWDADLDLDLWNATSGSSPGIDGSFTSSSNESVSTVGTDADGAADRRLSKKKSRISNIVEANT
mgnify:CR=1 FL=1